MRDPRTYYDRRYPYTMVDPSTIPGLIKEGNVDLFMRPYVYFDENGQRFRGTVDSYNSPTNGQDPYGEQVVYPTIDDGRKWSVKEAYDRAVAPDGRNMGIFDNYDNAERFAYETHLRQERMKMDDEMNNAILNYGVSINPYSGYNAAQLGIRPMAAFDIERPDTEYVGEYPVEPFSFGRIVRGY